MIWRTSRVSAVKSSALKSSALKSLFVSVALVIPSHCLLAEEGNQEENQAIVEEELTKYDRDHWSYEPIVRPTVPEVSDSDWSITNIDRFVLAKLESESLQPAPPADKSTLLRRVCWDLLGLPPSIDQIQQFVNDERPDAYERLVDSLLASPQYGQRWAQPWLDLARFAETDGYEHDKLRKDAWKYRDWVIDATNNDLAYDDFVRLQIAGDLEHPADDDAVLATAFCLSGPDMPDINSQEERRHVLLNEITSTVGSVLMGLQFGCAQCHDHKYDAISQADFYRLRAFFDSAIELKQNRSVGVLASYEDFPRTHLMHRGDWQQPGPELYPAFPRVVNPSGEMPSEKVAPRLELARWLTETTNPLTPRVAVNRIWQHHFGSGLTTSPSDFGVMGDSPTHPDLLDYLAHDFVRDDWSVKRLHRTIVLSSVYQTASVRPVDADLGAQWDLAQASDPENRLLSHFTRRRLDAEAIRDGLFSVSDSLNRKMAGPSVSPPLPREMLSTLLKGQWSESPNKAEHYRRSVYLFARRNLRYPFFATFDRPSADQPCALRNQSTTGVQSLMLFNSELMMDAASRLCDLIESETSNSKSQIQSLYLRLYARRPTGDELDAAERFLSTDATLVDVCRAMLNSNEFLYID
ncbi:DUF1549 and DUF1553 domain-containing protein [Stieleria varia]|uniref:Planctomycete cytochrome C n=1 Tax=Stieleria varia TaxID=2528005 RepID=A0A5C6B9U5_9BACT|nr:DUF1549 and DUF1553 domain-containing protein [Stieleria varia]TWU08402.1 hypothetical protein Pla52n_09850 [Stieleria varia]